MKKKLITVISAVLLVLGLIVVSCDDGSTSGGGGGIPSGLLGTYSFGGNTLVIKANGTGSLNDDPCTFSVAGGVLTVTVSGKTVRVNYTVSGDDVTFSDPDSDDPDLKNLFDELADESPITPDKDTQSGGNTIVGTWNSTAAVGTFPVGKKIFVINANGTGTAYNTGFDRDDASTWTWTNTRLKLTVIDFGFGDMYCEFDYAIVGGKLELSNPESGSGTFDYMLEAFVDFFPSSSALPPADIDDFTWVNPTAGFVGTWKSTVAFGVDGALPIGTSIFVINADGTGTVQFGVAAPAPGPCTYKVTADNTKLLLTVDNFGKCMYNAAFSNSGNTLTLTNAVPDSDGAVLVSYTAFTPVTK
jgi:hypothetical protein